MTEFELKHGLSQDEPGPLEPVEIAQQPGAAPATGNTARDQEMYASGIAVGEENAKHNAAIRAGVPSGWKLVPIEPTDAMLDAGIKQHRCEQGDPWYSSPDLGEGDCRDIYAAMLNAASPAPGVSTVEDAGAHKVVIDFDQVGSAGPFYVFDGRVTIPAVTVMDLVRMAAPAAGDALDAARYRWLRKWKGQEHEPPFTVQHEEFGCLWLGDLDAAIDAAIAQRKGGA